MQSTKKAATTAVEKATEQVAKKQLMSHAVKSQVATQGVANAAKKAGRNRFVPDASATGAHSVFRRDPISGRTSKYATYQFQTNPRNPNPWELVKRFDKTGKFHHNNVLGKDIYTPHVHDPLTPGGIRYPYIWEVP